MEKKINPLLNCLKSYKKVNLINPYIFGGYHPSAANYITAAGLILSQAVLWNDFVVGCIADDVWDYIDYIYPFLGSTDDGFKYNAKNPIDSDAAFRLQFLSTSTFSNAKGYENLTASSGAKTFYNELTHGLDYNTHVLLYLKRKTNTNGCVWGCSTGSPARRSIVYVNIANYADYADFYTATVGTGRLSKLTGGLSSQGSFLFTRTSSTTIKEFKNGSLYASLTDDASATTRPNEINAIGGRLQGGTLGEVQQCEFRLVCKGRGLTDTKAVALQNRVQTLQTGLARNLY